jgi:hypothetical protein
MAGLTPSATPMTTRKEVPKFTGSQTMTHYVFGHNPRKAHYTSMIGTSGRKRGGLHSADAPHKTDMHLFDSKFGAGGFGGTGGTDEI